MKPAFLKEDAFVSDLERARASGKPRIWWLGQSGFIVHSGAKSVLLDPYLSDSLTKKYAQTDKPHER
ncbi:MAG TPA: MBL fold metallo-hydrolase, partial [Verrucomicrobiae bacterium]|nr:MBL fold metallo-hydrolase [Verrucomicrobiae bacterium]